ncbi:hypothetical protein Acife_1910 [Acidithiobacillus ferrivorans SS3]|uniref:Uncharacterized protein n=1 Tax=Acidithiobacillus ferrivorans SS3 TaxID=743299 RepID=G0JLI4_9PROT|nr:hypothetical protein [Acidithiobacillus ferrivorans]AEM48033.1 hypothetical protein Acife_1910 [Acidithiobacillus ferrivorans SS3]
MSSTNVDVDDIESWAMDEGQGAGKSRQRRLNHLVASIEYDRKMPQPNALPVNSGERRIAEARQRRLLSKAVAQGYQPPGQEIASEIAKEAAGASIGLPLGVNPVDAIQGVTTCTEQYDAQAKRDRSRKKQRASDFSSGQGLGFGFSQN